MKVGVYTKALEELTPRDGARGRSRTARSRTGRSSRASSAPTSMQLAAALHPSERDVPAEAQLDPVANTLDLRQPFTPRAPGACRRRSMPLAWNSSDLGYFDNLLHHDAATRAQEARAMLRVFDAAVLLGVDAVCGFVGRNLEA